MRITSTMLPAAFALTMLAGCSVGSQGPASTLPSSGGMHFASEAQTGVKRAKYKGLHDLYVLEFDSNQIVLLKNKSYGSSGTISNGIDGPNSAFLDTAGNLYVANSSGGNITQYAPAGTSPSFTYSASIVTPLGVSVDAHGNVFDADANGFSTSGFINEYAQGKNRAIQSCSIAGHVAGVAVDAAGDVFVDYYNASYQGNIAEYKKGLAGCKATVLGVTLNSPLGMSIDKHGDLLVCVHRALVVIDPPYRGISGSLGSLAFPNNVTISRSNRLVFVADPVSGNVSVLKYPSGDLVQTLGSSNGVSDPVDAVDGPNAAY